MSKKKTGGQGSKIEELGQNIKKQESKIEEQERKIEKLEQNIEEKKLKVQDTWGVMVITLT